MTVSNDIHTDYQLSAGRFTQGGLRRMDTAKLERDLLIRARAFPNWHGKLDRFKIHEIRWKPVISETGRSTFSIKERLSRRTILGSLAALPVPYSTQGFAEQPTGDVRFQELGREFDDAAAQIDYAIDHGSELSQETLDRLSLVEAEIAALQATGIMGMKVKARAACWALLGDLNPAGESTTDRRMALSIVRDLIRLYDASLERPDALKKLLDGSDDANHSAVPKMQG